MSTIVVVKKDGFAVIGADTLTKLGSTRESATYIANATKINKVGQSYLAHVGHASIDLVLASYFNKLKPKPRLESRQAIFEAARTMHTVLKEDYFLNPIEDSDDPFESTQLQCLIANPDGIFGVYSLRSVQEYERFYAFGSGYRIALGAMHAIYERDFTAEEIARAGLEAAAEFDDSTAAPFELHRIKLRLKNR